MNRKTRWFRKMLFIICASLLPITANAWEIGGTFLQREGSNSLDQTLRRAFGVSVATSTERGEIEFQTLMSQMTWDKGQSVTDKNVLFVWGPFFLLDDLQVNVEKKESYRIWENSFHYWHKIYNDKDGVVIEVGSGLVVDLLEKHSEIKVSYLPYYGYPFDGYNVILVTPHYQNTTSDQVFLFSGIPIGARLKIPFYFNRKVAGYWIFSGERMYGANPNKVHYPTIQDKPMGSLGGLRFSSSLNFRF